MSTPSLLRALIRETLLAEKRKRRGKPGGPRTDMGALRQIYPGEFAVTVKGAVDSAEGDVDRAAANLDVSTRTLYHYLDTVPDLKNVETTADKTEEDEGWSRTRRD